MSDYEFEPIKRINSYDIPVIEKILKLEKKNSSISLAESKGSNQNEQNLRNFWWHVNHNYFKKIEEPDLERIDYLLNLFDMSFKDSETKYSDPNAYETFKALVTSEYKRLHQDIQCDKVNLRNLQKQYYLSTLLSPLIHNDSSQKPQAQKIFDAKFKFQLPKKRDIKAVLAAEAEALDSLIDTVKEKKKSGKKNKPSADSDDEISVELRNLEKEYDGLSTVNTKMLERLRRKSESGDWTFPISCDELSVNSIENICTLPEGTVLSKVELNKMIDSIDTQQKYLKNLLIQLDNCQAAESIKCVIDYGRDPADGNLKFLVLFEDAIYQKEVWVDERSLDLMDQLREESLFKIANMPQKTVRSLSTGNIAGFQAINEKVQKKHLPLKEKPWKALLKRKISTSNIGKVNNAILDLREYGLCHHCKNLFPNSQMLSCKYKSSTMGLPQLNPAFLDPFSHNRYSHQAPKRSIYGSKRNVFSFYTRRKGSELCCLRKFCRGCLKKYYEQTYSDVKSRDDWKCPFCQCICYCSRCMRNDRINRMASFYQLIGGNLDEIKDASLFEHLVYSKLTECGEQSPSKSMYSKQPLRPTSRKRNSSVLHDMESLPEKPKQGKKMSILNSRYNKMEEENSGESKSKRSTSRKKIAGLTDDDVDDLRAQLELNNEGRESQLKKLKAQLEKFTTKHGKRSNPMPTAKRADEVSQSNPIEVKRKRGRPRKYPLESTQSSSYRAVEVQKNDDSMSQRSKSRAVSPAVMKKVKKAFRSTSTSPSSKSVPRSTSERAKQPKDYPKRAKNASTSKSSRKERERETSVKNSKLQSANEPRKRGRPRKNQSVGVKAKK